jgi:hypothetical protein
VVVVVGSEGVGRCGLTVGSRFAGEREAGRAAGRVIVAPRSEQPRGRCQHRSSAARSSGREALAAERRRHGCRCRAAACSADMTECESAEGEARPRSLQPRKASGHLRLLPCVLGLRERLNPALHSSKVECCAASAPNSGPRVTRGLQRSTNGQGARQRAAACAQKLADRLQLKARRSACGAGGGAGLMLAADAADASLTRLRRGRASLTSCPLSHLLALRSPPADAARPGAGDSAEQHAAAALCGMCGMPTPPHADASCSVAERQRAEHAAKSPFHAFAERQADTARTASLFDSTSWSAPRPQPRGQQRRCGRGRSPDVLPPLRSAAAK